MTASTLRVTVVVGLICLRLSAQAPPATAIVGGTLVDGNGGAPIADAVVLTADPLADIKNIRKIDKVFKEGGSGLDRAASRRVGRVR
jgi:hypothetical protein